MLRRDVHSTVSSTGVSACFLDFRQNEATASGVEVEELGVAAPVDGGFELALCLFFAELLVEQVEEEVLGDGVVALGIEGAA